MLRVRERLPSNTGLADLVVPLTYWIQNGQSAFRLRQYNENPHPRVRRQHGLVLNWLLYLAILLHERCIGRRTGRAVGSGFAVPSLRGRIGVHPFEVITRQMNATRDSDAWRKFRRASEIDGRFGP
jgi:hypothetical protein